MTESALYSCGHCEKEFYVTGYASHVRNCIAKAAAVQAARRPPRFSQFRSQIEAVQIPITRQLASKETA